MKAKRFSRLRLVFLCFFGLFVVVPILFTLVNSFSTGTAYGLLPQQWSLAGWYEVLIRRPHYLVKFWNSLILSVAIAAGQALVASLAGYAFSKFRFPGREPLFFIVIIVMMMPYQVTLVSNYFVIRGLGLMGSWAALIIPAVFSPFGVFLLRQVFDTCPDELLDAARIDGAGDLTILFRILLPRSRAGVVSLVLLTFVDAWNMVEQPLVYLENSYDYPLSVFLSQMSGQDVGVLCVCGILAALPVLLLFLYYDQDLADGISLSQIH